MIELYIDPRGEIAVENMAELLEQFPKYAERAVASALKSEGYNLKEQMKMAVLRGGPEGHKWEKLHPYSAIMSRGKKRTEKAFKWEWSEKVEGQKRRRVKKWLYQQRENGHGPERTVFNALQKFAGGLRYKYDNESSLMSVGFVNPNGEVGQNFARLVKMHAAGYQTVATRELQKKAWKLDMRLNTGTIIKVPARPLVEPIFQAEKGKMAQRIENKFFLNIARYISGAEKK